MRSKYLKAYPNDEKVQDFLVATWVNAEKFDAALSFLKQQRATTRRPASSTADHQRLHQVQSLPRGSRLGGSIHAAGPWPVLSDRHHAWSKSYNDPTTTFEDRCRSWTSVSGVAAAVDVKPELHGAMVYYNLLYREKASSILTTRKKKSIPPRLTSGAKALALRESRSPERRRLVHRDEAGRIRGASMFENALIESQKQKRSKAGWPCCRSRWGSTHRDLMVVVGQLWAVDEVPERRSR